MHVLFKQLFKLSQVCSFFLVPVLKNNGIIAWVVIDSVKQICSYFLFRITFFNNQVATVQMDDSCNVNRDNTGLKTDTIFRFCKTVIQFCEVLLTINTGISQEGLNSAEHILHILVFRCNYNFRCFCDILYNTCLHKGASHNRNVLTRAGKAKVRLKLGAKQSIKELCSAVYSHCWQNVFVD